MTGVEPAAATQPAPSPSPLVYLAVSGVIVGSFLPWVQIDGASMSAWEMPFKFLLGRENDLGGPNVGPFLLVVLFALAPLVTKQSLGWRTHASLGALMVEAAVMTVLRVRALEVSPSIGVGAVVTLVGGALLALEAWMVATRS